MISLTNFVYPCLAAMWSGVELGWGRDNWGFLSSIRGQRAWKTRRWLWWAAMNKIFSASNQPSLIFFMMKFWKKHLTLIWIKETSWKLQILNWVNSTIYWPLSLQTHHLTQNCHIACSTYKKQIKQRFHAWPWLLF